MNKKKIIIKITEMTCASCAVSNEKALVKTKGIISANVNFATKKAAVEYDSDILNEEQVKKIIQDNGYGIENSSQDRGHMNHTEHNINHEAHKHNNEDAVKNWRVFLGSAILSAPLILEMIYKLRTGIEMQNIDLIIYIHILLASAVVFYFGRRFHKMAWKQAKHFRANMDTLISLGTLTAYFYSLWLAAGKLLLSVNLPAGEEGYFEAAALIVTLILLGKYFEAKSIKQSGEAMRKLMELSAKRARVLIGGREKEIDVSEIKIGDIVLVKPSEKIPLDGEILEGESNVNESMLTGESMPAEKKTGAKVFGATLNEDGILKIKVSQVGEGTMLAQIIKTVEEAQGSKAPIQKLADKIAGIFVPVVIFIALAAFSVWFFAGGNFSAALINAVAVLVIACPCALGLATPTAIMAGTGKGAKRGIIFKSGESFERAKDITMVVFDKTGTLTKGTPQVIRIISNPEFNFGEEKIIKIAASMAKSSEHPLSKAVADYAKRKNINLAEFIEAREIKGIGMAAVCAEHNIQVMLGNKKLLEKNNLETVWADKILEDKNSGIGTKLFVAHNGNIIGAIILADEARGESKKIIADLKNMNLRVAMITGDNQAAARAIAEELGIEKVLAEVLPAEKSEEIKKLQKQGEKIVFVGDGINDAPSLVQADLGIAMGSGTDIAKETGQIILMQSNLKKVAEAITISKITFSAIKQNLFWAFFYNIIAIPLAAAGLLNPIIAAGAMTFSSVSVVLNSLRIYRKK